MKEFDDLTRGLNVTEYSNGTKVATLPDGRTVNLREKSSGNVPTIEIRDSSVEPTQITKFRYEP